MAPLNTRTVKPAKFSTAESLSIFFGRWYLFHQEGEASLKMFHKSWKTIKSIHGDARVIYIWAVLCPGNLGRFFIVPSLPKKLCMDGADA